MSRQRSADLFPTDQPLPASLMVGRREDVREVATALIGGRNLILAGPRRTGKTSVCDAAMGEAERQGAYVVAVDLFGLPRRRSWPRRCNGDDLQPFRPAADRSTRRTAPDGWSPMRRACRR